MNEKIEEVWALIQTLQQDPESTDGTTPIAPIIPCGNTIYKNEKNFDLSMFILARPPFVASNFIRI